MTPELAQRSRQMLARDVLQAPVLAGAPLLAGLRTNPLSTLAWDTADSRFAELSGGERIVFGWLSAVVWPHHYSRASKHTAREAIEWCLADGDRQSAQAIATCDGSIRAIDLAELGVTNPMQEAS